jgi:hypothetical protein
MALVCCILGRFLGVVCHCLPPCLDVTTSAARCLHVRKDTKDPSSERWNYGRERLSGNFAYMASIHAIRNLLHAANLRHGTDRFTSPPKEGVLRIFSPTNLGTKGQHTTPRPPKPLIINIWYRKSTWTTTFNCGFSYKIEVYFLHLSILLWLRVKCYIPRNTNVSSCKSSDNLKDGNIWILAYSLGLDQRPVCCHFHNHLFAAS